MPSTAAQLLGEKWPALATYCPKLSTVSAPQTTFLLLNDYTEVFYGGAVGGGKTAALLMAALQYVDVPGYSAIILRRTFPELEQPNGPIRQSLEWFSEVPENIRPVYNKTDHVWTFPSGAQILFGHLDTPNAMIRYQGGGYHLVAFDELTHFDEESYEFIGFSRTRRPREGPLSKVPMRVRGTANPGGPGHGWVKRRFIDERKPDVQFVPSRLTDNPGIDYDDYVSRLDKLDPILRQQLLDGDWGVFQGAAFNITDDHLIEDFPLGDAHNRFEAADYGLNGSPWALVAVDYEGNLIFHDMLTTVDERGKVVYTSDLIPSQLCPLIVGKRKAGWGFGHPAVMDPSVWHRSGHANRWGRQAMLSDEFIENGVQIIRGNNDPRAGLIRVRELLAHDPRHPFPTWHPRAGQLGAPRIFFTRACGLIVEELKAAPLQPLDKTDGGEKIDPDWESRKGHAVALVRYAVLTKPDASTEPFNEDPLHPPDPPEQRRAELLVEHRRKREESLARRRRAYTT